jgi:hypothetical protein
LHHIAWLGTHFQTEMQHLKAAFPTDEAPLNQWLFEQIANRIHGLYGVPEHE